MLKTDNVVTIMYNILKHNVQSNNFVVFQNIIKKEEIIIFAEKLIHFI
jgi:hypothetical protein